MKWMRHRGQVMIEGTNAQFMRLLNVSPVPAVERRAETVESVIEHYSKEEPNVEPDQGSRRLLRH